MWFTHTHKPVKFLVKYIFELYLFDNKALYFKNHVGLSVCDYKFIFVKNKDITKSDTQLLNKNFINEYFSELNGTVTAFPLVCCKNDTGLHVNSILTYQF